MSYIFIYIVALEITIVSFISLQTASINVIKLYVKWKNLTWVDFVLLMSHVFLLYMLSNLESITDTFALVSWLKNWSKDVIFSIYPYINDFNLLFVFPIDLNIQCPLSQMVQYHFTAAKRLLLVVLFMRTCCKRLLLMWNCFFCLHFLTETYRILFFPKCRILIVFLSKSICHSVVSVLHYF